MGIMIAPEEHRARHAAHEEQLERWLVHAVKQRTAFISDTLRDLGATEETLGEYGVQPVRPPPEPQPDPITGWPATHKISERIAVSHRGKLIGHVNTLSSTPYADAFTIAMAFKPVAEGDPS